MIVDNAIYVDGRRTDNPTDLELVENRRFGNGVVLLRQGCRHDRAHPLGAAALGSRPVILDDSRARPAFRTSASPARFSLPGPAPPTRFWFFGSVMLVMAPRVHQPYWVVRLAGSVIESICRFAL